MAVWPGSQGQLDWSKARTYPAKTVEQVRQAVSVTNFAPYKPRPKTAAMLERAMQYVKSVRYTVSARWLFYRLYQEGLYHDKKDYKDQFMDPLAEARKRMYDEWRPWTLSDETRSPIYRGRGFADQLKWLEEMGLQECQLDRWAARSAYVEIWYEAKAMTGQFEYYTKAITLRRFGGQPSIPFKWEVVPHFDQITRDYPGKPIVVLYFGDNDKHGNQIPKSATDDIKYWCGQRGIEFSFYRAGLNDGQELEFDIPENPEHRGTYQWEALSDEAARTIIIRALSTIPDLTANDEEVTQAENEVTEKFKQLWPKFVDMMEES